MSQNRHRSAPKGNGAPLSPPSSQNPSNWSPAMTAIKFLPNIASASTQTVQAGPKSEENLLLKQAEALANMHFELNLHTVFSLATRLEKEVQQLVIRTADDQDFRLRNEDRMTKMMVEIQTVKSYMSQIGGNHEPATRADIERLQQAMSDTTTEWNMQLKDARAKIDDISTRMNNVSLPVVGKNSKLETSQFPESRMETRAMRKGKTDISSRFQKQQSE
ncbi:hypothetical protein FBEOM_14065 [Fusarium beomiforme]|uniref:Uncharacterized protein n=1 Tax=Fusarium beomiforme TaxID=44412 RepID=A0A9P5A4H5_9HYPO|nr:hypothetical protein FBEOM_14065 [Fusarium beomiforme]